VKEINEQAKACSTCADSARRRVGCRFGLPRSAPYFAVQPQKGRSRRVVLQSTKCGADVPTRRRRRQGSPVRNILLSTTNDRVATRVDENWGWPPAGLDNSGIRQVNVIQFSKIREPLPPTPYDENDLLRYWPRILFTRQRALRRLSSRPTFQSCHHDTTRIGAGYTLV